MTRLAAISGLALLAACAAEEAPSPAEPAAETEAFSLDVALDIAPGEDWQVRYALNEPVERLVFPRSRGDYRRESWDLEDGYEIARIADSDVVRRTDGAPFTAFTAQVTPHTGIIMQEYTPAIPFTDGALAIFLDQFHAGDASNREDVDPLAGEFDPGLVRWPESASLTLDAGGYAHIEDGGLARSGEGYALGNSGYLYAGSLEPLRTDDLSAVIDAGAPDWLREELLSALPRLFEDFTEAFGPLGGTTPAVYAIYDELEGGSYSIKGGAIGQQVTLEIALGRDVIGTDALRRHLLVLFAHESAHLWQFRDARASGFDIAWVHEGGAEALAWFALYRAGEVDRAAIEAAFARFATECAPYLDVGALTGAHRRDAYRAYYVCGALVWLAAHASAAEAGQGDLFDLTRAFLARAAENDRNYTAETLFEAAAERAGPELAAALRTFTEAEADSGEAAVTTLLQAAGIETSFTEGEARLGTLPL